MREPAYRPPGYVPPPTLTKAPDHGPAKSEAAAPVWTDAEGHPVCGPVTPLPSEVYSRVQDSDTGDWVTDWNHLTAHQRAAVSYAATTTARQRRDDAQRPAPARFLNSEERASLDWQQTLMAIRRPRGSAALPGRRRRGHHRPSSDRSGAAGEAILSLGAMVFAPEDLLGAPVESFESLPGRELVKEWAEDPAADAEFERFLDWVREEGGGPVTTGAPVSMVPYKAASKGRALWGMSGDTYQAMHMLPQALAKRAGVNSDEALTILAERSTHSGLDRAWKAAFKSMADQGINEATGADIYREIARSFDQSPTVSAQLKQTLKQRLQNEMAEYGMNASTRYRIPYAK